MSILNGIKGLISNELVSGLAGQLGESNDGINKALGGIVPSLLGSLAGAKQEDHSMLSGLLSQAGNLGGGNLVGDLLGGLTGGGANANSGISGIGNSLVKGLLGDKVGGVVDLISKVAGIKSSSSSSLMGIGGSLIASFLGKKLLGGGSISSIISSLMSEKKEIAAAAPSGISSLLGLGNVFSSASETVSNVAGAASSAAKTVASYAEGGDEGGGSGLKWLWPLLLALLLGGALYAFLGKGCKKGADDANAGATTEQTSTNTGDATADGTSTVTAGDAGAASATGTATTGTATASDANATTGTATGADAKAATSTANANGAAGANAGAKATTSIKLANNTELKVIADGIEDRLIKFINDPNAKGSNKSWFDFDNIQFATGSSTNITAGAEQIANIAAILKAYPKLKIKVGGYTDNTGKEDANLKLSDARAKTVYEKIVAAGGSKDQFLADKPYEGFGSQFPVADNSTEEGRARNRRISICVREK